MSIGTCGGGKEPKGKTQKGPTVSDSEGGTIQVFPNYKLKNKIIKSNLHFHDGTWHPEICLMYSSIHRAAHYQMSDIKMRIQQVGLGRPHSGEFKALPHAQGAKSKN